MTAAAGGSMVDLLRQPLPEIRRVQDEKLRRMLALAARGHDWYRERWAAARVGPVDVRRVADLRRLPLTRKQDLMDDPERFRLRCPDLPLHERVLWEVMYTTGSTGEPTPIYSTTHDWQAYIFQSRRLAEITGITDRDVIAALVPLTRAPMGAFVRCAPNAFAAGAAIVAGLTGAPFGDYDVHRSLDEAVALAARHHATVLWGVTSFVRRVLVRAAELGADFRSVRMCAVTGEASSPALRQDMRDRLAALGAAGTRIFDRFGSTEIGAFAQCREDGDWHNPAPEILYQEIVDPETGEPLADGERGAHAITHLDRRGTVLIRYLTGDVASLTHVPCPHCGRSGDRLVGPVVRAKDLLKVKGMLVNPSILLEAIPRVPGVDEFQVVLQRAVADDPFSMDEMVVRVATGCPDRGALAAAVSDAAGRAVGVRPRVEFAAASDIYDPGRDAKAARLVDRR